MVSESRQGATGQLPRDNESTSVRAGPAEQEQSGGHTVGSPDSPPVVLSLRGVRKSFGTVTAVEEVTFDVHDGEVVTLLGTSGCGKTTTLRLIAGLERCDGGEIIYDGVAIDRPSSRSFVPTKRRKIGMVFQSYALWPHLSVYENVAYGLKLRRERDIRPAVERALEMVGLEGLAERPATGLSGGQQQRVAVARSLVYGPRVLLLDEPFSNVDARRREQMRVDLKLLQRQLKVPVVFVTHDQLEALSFSDRIAIMNRGRIEQIGKPVELYRNPATPYVRDFLGRTILVRGTITETGTGEVTVSPGNGHRIVCESRAGVNLTPGDECVLAIRPEEITVSTETDVRSDEPSNTFAARTETLLFLGDHYQAQVLLPWGQPISLQLPSSEDWREGTSLTLHLPKRKLQLWPGENDDPA